MGWARSKKAEEKLRGNAPPAAGKALTRYFIRHPPIQPYIVASIDPRIVYVGSLRIVGLGPSP
jgi:hypothetical protein